MSDETEVRIHEEPDSALGSAHIQTNQEETQEDETVKLQCDPCKSENKSAQVAGFCEECSELLCKDCLNAHKRVTVTRDHTIKENLEKSAGIKEQKKTTNLCPIHTDMELEYFCQTHDDLACLTCNSIIHKHCEQVENVSAICCRTDFDTEIQKIESEMDTLLTDVENASYEVKVSLDAVQLNHDEGSAHIEKVRREMNDHLDQLQSNVQHKIDGLRKDDLHKMKTNGEKCKAMRFEVDSLRSKLRGNTQKSPYDKFMAVKSARCLIRSNRNQLQEIRRSNGINRYFFQPSQELRELKTRLQNFGNIDPNSTRIKTAKYIQEFTLKTQDSGTKGRITGMEVVDVNQIVTVDNSNKTMSLTDTTEHILLSTVKFESAPWNVARLSDNILAVTLPEEKRIAKVEKTKKNCLILIKDQTIAVNGKCYSLAAHGGKLFVQFSDTEDTLIAILDETGIVLKTFKKSAGYERQALEHSNIAVDHGCKFLFISAELKQTFTGPNRRIIAVSLEDGKITEVHSFQGGSGALTTDRTGVLFYYGYDGIYCFFIGGPDPSKIIENIYSSVTSLAYCNKKNVLFVASGHNEIRMYYVV